MANRQSPKLKPPLGSVRNGSHPLSQGLKGWWLFNENGGTKAYDSSGRNNVGNIVNGPVWNNLGLVFNGSNNYVSIPTTIGQPTEFTVSHWIKLTANQTSKTIFSNYNATGAVGWVTGISDGETNKIKFYLGAAVTDYSSFALSNGVWYHVAVTYSPNAPKIYINGVLNNSSSNAITYGATAPVNSIGSLQETTGQYFNGAIDDVRYYNRVLSAQEIKMLYETPYANIARVKRRMITGSGLVVTDQTILGIARIARNVLQTITGKSRITTTTNQTESGVARLQNTASQTETGIARIRRLVTQTIDGVSRITTSVFQTITGLARIQKAVTQIITGVSRIQKTVTETITGVASVVVTTLRTITGNSRISVASNQTITGVARVSEAPTPATKRKVVLTTSINNDAVLRTRNDESIVL